MVTFSISEVEGYEKVHSPPLCQISTGIVNESFSPFFCSISNGTGSTIWSLFTKVINAPFFGSSSIYFTPVTPWSSFELVKNQPRQNQDRSSPPTFSIVLKKSHG